MEFTIESKEVNNALDNIFTKDSKDTRVATCDALIKWANSQSLASYGSKTYENLRNIIYIFLTNSNIAGGYKKMLINRLRPGIIYRDSIFVNVLFKLYNEKQLQAYEIIGKNRFKINEESLYKIVTNEFFNSGYVVPMSGDSYSDANVRAVLLYHSDVISVRIVRYLCDLIDSTDYKGKIDAKKLKEYVTSKCPNIIEKDSTLQLYFDLV